MNRDQPPRLATWLLDHLGDRYRRDALVGDLTEEYRRGRSGGWYWQQTLWAVAASCRTPSPRRYGLFLLVWWWTLLGFASFEWKWPILILALDPGPYLVHRRKQKHRGSQGACAP